MGITMRSYSIVASLLLISGLSAGLSAEDAPLVIGSEAHTLNKQPSVVFTNRESLGLVSDNGVFTGVLSDGGTGSIQLDVSAAKWTFDGSMRAASGRSETRINLAAGSHVRLGDNAVINQQMGSMINARPLFVSGAKDSIFELNENFQADQMGYGDIEAWQPNGFSVLYVDGPELRSHHSQSLPVVNKRSGNGNHTFHGVISFGAKGTTKENRWVVDSNPQGFVGLFKWNGPLEIHTKKHLKILGHYSEDSHCYFGGKGPLRKTGPGTLAIVGTQYHPPGSQIIVEEGRLLFMSSTSNPGIILKDALGPDTSWDELNLVISANGSIEFRTPTGYRSHLASLRNEGKLIIDGAGISIKGDILSGPESEIAISFGSLSQKHPVLRCSGSIALGGILRITGERLKTGDYPIVVGEELKGSLKVELPAGYAGTFANGLLTISSE